MQPNADLARTLCATTGDSAEPRLTEAAGVAVCRQTGKQMPERDEMDVQNWTTPSLPSPPGYATRDNYFFFYCYYFILDEISFGDERK